MKNTEISAAAAALGRKGGSAKSDAKTAAARVNGVSGGRPRTKFELIFRGAEMASYFPRYRRNHDSIKSAKATAATVRVKLSKRGLPTACHDGIVYGPGCGKDGVSV